MARGRRPAAVVERRVCEACGGSWLMRYRVELAVGERQAPEPAAERSRCLDCQGLGKVPVRAVAGRAW